MNNSFLKELNDEKSFYSLLENIENCKVGFYSIGLYPASLAYNCALHSNGQNILLAPRSGRDLLGAFSKDILSNMEPKIIEKIKSMGYIQNKVTKKINTLEDLLLNCNIVVLASNSNHIQSDINHAIELRRSLDRENVVLCCLVGSFCFDIDKDKPYILCAKYPALAFFTGFHRHGALRNPKDCFTANFCHPEPVTAFIGAKILNNLSPCIQVSPGVHNIECQYIKSIKNVSSIFAGFVNDYHSDKPGMLPTINTVLLSQCLNQAASVSSIVKNKNNSQNAYFSLKELGYGEENIISKEYNRDKVFSSSDYTFSQLNAVKADVLGSMSLPTAGKPTRNFQAGQVLSDMLLNLKRCPNDDLEFINWCDKFSLSQGGLEGLKSLKFWPKIYREYKIKNYNCSMINLIYLCFYGNCEEKKVVYNVLISPEEITNFCQESVRPNLSLDLKYKLNGIDIFDNAKFLYEEIFVKSKFKHDFQKISKFKSFNIKKNYVDAINLINKCFDN